MATKIQQIEGINRRLEKAKQLVAEGKIRPVLPAHRATQRLVQALPCRGAAEPGSKGQ